jgi:predicted enzyme related to lactoylglutathione lyase
MTLLRKVDAVPFHTPDLDAGIRFYAEHLGHEIAWRNDAIGQAALRLRDSDTEIVLTRSQRYEPNWLIDDADAAARLIAEGGGEIVTEPSDIPVGRVAVASDPFGNVLVLIELSKGAHT